MDTGGTMGTVHTYLGTNKIKMNQKKLRKITVTEID